MHLHKQLVHLQNVRLITDSGIGGEFETHLEMLGIISGGVRTLFGLKLSEKKYEKKGSKARLSVHRNALQSQPSWVEMTHSLLTEGNKES